MQRSVLTYLEHVELAISDIENFAKNKSSSEYKSDRMLQAAVERKFILVGEAFAQMEHHFPGERQRIADVRRIVSFRNLLVHQYESAGVDEVYSAVRGPMLTLRVQVRDWIAELDPHRGDTYSA